MRLRRKRDSGVALRAPDTATGRSAEPVVPVGDAVRPAPPAPPPPRRSRVPLAVAGVIALLIVAGAVAIALLRTQDGEAGELAPPVAVVGDTRSVLVVVEGDDGRAGSIALFTSDGGDDHRLLVAPRDLTMQLPGYGEGNIGDSLLIEDAALLRLALINELGIRIDEAIKLGPGDIAGVLGEAVRIDLPNAFIVNERDGAVVSASAGSDVFVPQTAETLLLTQGADSPLDWLVRQRAVWEAIAERIAASPAAAIAASPTFESLAEPLGEATVSVLPVERVGVGISELYVVSRDSDLLTERIAFLALVPGSRPRVEILNATTFPAVSRPLAEQLIERGFRIIKTDNAEERFRTDTLVIAQGIASQQAALDVQAILGSGEVVVQASGSGVVDVSIIVGRDIADR
ncbi:MAG: LytR C-terminal domain-containing protein [Acidimicrobiia bacterium]|nr:LytR C-terminal domain-containing protein [Acidimicrobiia bacterium]MBT8217058.1 LytR C-terminal domain-containing protein [Acidimicrobiia bacterium]NNF11516.1 LytR C-terminal domain-containing protein [Acidimicrobiia bacterium]NNL71054.1 LytR C-terminal domain-containing protein [Acidimicrobiia bacterium]